MASIEARRCRCASFEDKGCWVSSTAAWLFPGGLNRDPCTIHLNIALQMEVSLYFGGRSHVSNGQNVSFKEPCSKKSSKPNAGHQKKAPNALICLGFIAKGNHISTKSVVCVRVRKLPEMVLSFCFPFKSSRNQKNTEQKDTSKHHRVSALQLPARARTRCS